MADNVVIIQDDDDNTVTIYEGVAPNAGGDHNHNGTYSPVGHTHDDRYYTEAETDALLDTKADAADIHTHLNKAVLDGTSASFTTADETKLDGIATGATANATNAQLRDRATHTGEQPISSVTNLQATLDGKAGSVHTHTLDSLSDVTISTPTDGQVLKYSAGAWVNGTDATGGGGGGAVDSVNGQTGTVVLTQDNVADGTTYKQYSQTEKTKLAGIETAADVTDATNVAAAGAVMESNTSTVSMSFVIDEDDMASNSATKLPTQQSVRAYVDAAVPSDFDDLTDGTTNKAYTATEKTKLAGVASGATANDTDANLKNRANHTGTQTASTISDFSTAADARITAATGVSVQGYDAELAAIAGLTSVADRLPYFTGSGTASLATFTSAGRALVDDADATAQRTTLGLGSLATSSTINDGNWSGTDLSVANGGTGVSTLTGIVKGNGTSAFSAATAGTDYVAPGGALGTPSSGTLTNTTGLPVSGITASTSAALGVGSIELGHASDTTLSRASAGRLAVEGVNVLTATSVDTVTNKTFNSPVINNPTGFLTGAAKITVSSTTPSSPTTGDIWVDTN